MELAHFSLCLFMTGLIWLVQLVHYPAFAYVEEKVFTQFESFHTQRISYIVMPAMIAELGTGVYLVSTKAMPFNFLISFLILFLIWCSTFFLSVPCHHQLSSRKNDQIIRRLTLTNSLEQLAGVYDPAFLFLVTPKAVYNGKRFHSSS